MRLKWLGYGGAFLVSLFFIGDLSFAKLGVLDTFFIDVNRKLQGDCTIFITPNKKVILIDSGDAASYKTVLLPFFKKYKIKHLDQVWLTHQHADHVGGFIEMMQPENQKLYPVSIGKVYSYDFYPASIAKKYESWVNYGFMKNLNEVLSRLQSLRVKVKNGDHFQIDGLKLNVLHGKNPDITDHIANNSSLIIRMVWGKTSYLMLGDAGRKQEAKFLQVVRKKDLIADVVKVSHHGWESMSPEFYKLTHMKIAVFQGPGWLLVKKEPQMLIKTFEKRGARVYTNPKHGTIHLQSDGAVVNYVR